MTSKLEKKASGLVELLVELTAEEFQKALQDAYKQNAKRFNVPGFRKGKAPYALAVRYYGESVLYDDAVDYALYEPYIQAVEEKKVRPIDKPELSIEKISGTEGLKVVLTIPVFPDVQLGQYKGVEAYRPSIEVKDEEVLEALKQVQERSGRLVPVEDRAAELEDTATIDFKGFVGEEAFEGGEGKGYDLLLGSGNFIPGFEDQIVGHKVGENFEVQVTFPETYHAKELAGKEARFEVSLHNLKKKELPELDDEFAKDVSEFDTLEEYKADLRKNLEKQAEERAEAEFTENVLRAAVDAAEVEVPEKLIEREINQSLAEQEKNMMRHGIQLNQYLQYVGKTLEEVRKEMRPSAETAVKTSIVLDAIADAENMEITEEDKQKEYERIAELYKITVEEVRERLEGDPNIPRLLLNEKTRDFLKAEAKPVDKKPEAKKTVKAKTNKAEKETKESKPKTTRAKAGTSKTTASKSKKTQEKKED